MTAWERAHRLPLGAEIALAFATGAGAFALAAVALAGIDTGVVVAFLGLVYLVAVVAIARLASIAYAVPVAMAGMLAYDWFYLPPTHPLELPDSANLVDLIVYLGVAVLLGELAAHAARRAEAAERARGQIAEEHGALRRVATLVARGAPAHELFAAVAAEAGILLDVHGIRIARYEHETELVHVAEWSKPGYGPPAYDRAKLEGTSVSAEVLHTGRAARIDDYEDIAVRAAFARGVDLTSVVGAPVVVDGRLWGVIIAWSARGPLPNETEGRLTDFAELVATAISNTDARTAQARLADEQAALRRVATLVAEGASPTAVFDAVAAEMERLLEADHVTLGRYEPGAEVTTVAHRGPDAQRVPPGTRVSHEGESVTAIVRRTERAARMDYSETAHGAIAEMARSRGIRVAIGAPIVVEGRLWGVIIASWGGEESPRADSEQRMAQFAQLLDTAIANADGSDQLAASRARLLTEGDEARRRVVRDLHDGAQQRLVHTIITLKLAQRALQENAGKAESLLGEALEHAQQGNAELRELAHGILPAALTRGGLRAGVGAVVARLDLPVQVDVPSERFPAEIEASAYFIVAETLTNVVKHAHAGHAEVTASVQDGMLHVEVQDDGIGGADPDGHGLVGIGDRGDRARRAAQNRESGRRRHARGRHAAAHSQQRNGYRRRVCALTARRWPVAIRQARGEPVGKSGLHDWAGRQTLNPSA